MDVTNIVPLLERLDGDIDGLEEVLQPLLDGLPDMSSKLPLLDKAKLYVLMAYSLESMIFSSLRLNSVDAKSHPIFKELTRVRQYFEKIKNIETPAPPPEQTLNKAAAISFIRADLAENKEKEMNTKLSEMLAKERAKAAIKAAQTGKKRKVDKDESEISSDSDNSGNGGAAVQVAPEPPKKRSKKAKGSKKDGKKQSKKAKAAAAAATE